MKIYADLLDPGVTQDLIAGKVGVLLTDTLYGVVCSARNQQSVERVYDLKGRDDTKSPIILISNSTQLFDQPSVVEEAILSDVWPGKRSVILLSKTAPAWIERGNGSVAYRLPDSAKLQQLITLTDSLIAPSANPQGELPARNIHEAIAYFGESVDFYVDSGEVQQGEPSQLIRINGDGTTERLR